jgi:hypothetical protein
MWISSWGPARVIGLVTPALGKRAIVVAHDVESISSVTPAPLAAVWCRLKIGMSAVSTPACPPNVPLTCDDAMGDDAG